MKKIWLTIGSLAFFQFFAKAQNNGDENTKVDKTAIEIVYNHYTQDGNNSAVTGGIGTEKLTIYGPQIGIKQTRGKQGISCKMGIDIISSASTDNIDFVVSSASVLDGRGYVNAVYENNLTEKNMTVFGGGGASMESDYLSWNLSAGINKTDPKRMTEYMASFSFYNDDLRWGRITQGYLRPVRLIYPAELRYQEWYEGYKRYSYNLKLGFTKVIDKRNTFGVFPMLTYQQGLLATPFHRIFFNDGSQAVEQLPDERYKADVGIKWHRFLGGKTIMKNTANVYADNFGILAFSLENETSLKLSPVFILSPNVRWFRQQGSRYFAPYQSHEIGSRYFTSDYDLSSFDTYTIGTAIKYKPFKKMGNNAHFNELVFRYAYMYRTNQLQGHIVSLAIQGDYNR